MIELCGTVNRWGHFHARYCDTATRGPCDCALPKVWLMDIATLHQVRFMVYLIGLNNPLKNDQASTLTIQNNTRQPPIRSCMDVGVSSFGIYPTTGRPRIKRAHAIRRPNLWLGSDSFEAILTPNRGQEMQT